MKSKPFCNPYFLLIPILFIGFFSVSTSSLAQDKSKILAKFGIGVNLGYKTYNGIGPIAIFHPNRYLDLELGAGYSGYNGGKFGGGLKFYPLKPTKVNLFLGLHYAITTGRKIETEVVDTRAENYRTFSNQYAIATLGFWVKGEQIQHQFALGYCQILTNPRIQKEDEQQKVDHIDEIKRGLAGGISFTYTIFVNLNKLDE
ncbi:MAG: hypothetical protein K1X82_07265 [Bacteroidia bacterium]|nr:hypothetical protein [Bacteroidia bacterium]